MWLLSFSLNEQSPGIAVACGYPEYLAYLWIENQTLALALTPAKRESTDYTDVLDYFTLPLSSVFDKGVNSSPLLQQNFGDLDGIERGALAQVVAGHKQQ